MTSEKDCVFCKILAGEIPSFKLYEDSLTYAFMDINPANPGHALVIPKHHAANLYEMPSEWLAACIVTARRVAVAVNQVARPDGLNMVQANGEGAAQSVQHFHIHLIPRMLGDELKLNWGLQPGEMDAIGELAGRITRAIEAGEGTV